MSPIRKNGSLTELAPRLPPATALRLRRALDAAAREALSTKCVHNDPVLFAHRYPASRDQEVVALLAALLAFGSARAFLPKIASLLDVLGDSPRDFVTRYRPSLRATFFERFRSRVYKGDDLRLLLCHLKEIYREYPTLEDVFLDSPAAGTDHRSRLAAFAGHFHRLDPAVVTGRSGASPGYRHLVADPACGSACKRWNLFLRWMVRKADGVDLGLWRRVSPADLVIPLDVHVGRISGLTGLRTRRTLDWKAAEEVTASLRSLDARDPLRYDFALSHLGISAGCRGRLLKSVCGACALRRVCRAAGRHDP